MNLFPVLRLAVGSGVAWLTFLPPTFAAPAVPANLGSGLGALVESVTYPQLAQAARLSAFAANAEPDVTSDVFSNVIMDEEGSVLVDVVLNGRIPTDQAAAALGSGIMQVTATDATYRQGIIEGYVDLLDVSALAKAPGVQAVHLVHVPVKNVGLTTSQGVVQHRVDHIVGLDGSGIKVGALSDSYNTSTNAIKAANDVASGDLPGPGNPLGHLTPVQVLQDFPAGTDEGRAMLQIVHDMAPGAALAFATADTGQVGFANNIRALAAAGCDVIVDDVSYFAEPMFSDGIIANAVDEVTSHGVSYFSSAGNSAATSAYRGVFSPNGAGLAPGATIPGTNCVLPSAASLSPGVYAGGFHNFASDGTDDAVSVTITTQSTLDVQWDDPYDVSPVVLGAELLTATGTVTTATPNVDIPFTATAGQRVSIFADEDPTAGNPIPDLILTLIDPTGNVAAVVDQGTTPEQLVTFLSMSGTYTIRISGFEGATGDFFLQVNSVSGVARVTSDFNVLVFSAAGGFITAGKEDNIATGRPIELFSVTSTGTSTIQVVFARANTPPPVPQPASVIRCNFLRSGRLLEHFSYSTPTTFGHNSAAGANGVAAYAFYAPFVPESFTSPGSVTIYFDQNNLRLPTPEVRLKPDMAAMDGGNTTFFGSDVTQDADTFPNFFGTSAAAPHAAAIGALVLQAHGGPGSVTPAQMKTVLQKSAFLHDLDPGAASGTARAGSSRISVTSQGDGTATSQFDNDSIRVSLTGPGSLATITFDLTNANPTETTPGLLFDPRTAGGVGYPFTLGTLVGVTPGDVSFNFDSPAGAAGQFQTLTLQFGSGSFTGGNSLGFGVDRDETLLRAGGGSASLLGRGVLIPSGEVVGGGATFSGTLEDGTTFSGVFNNRIGAGYSPLDGFGFINAETAVSLPLP